VQGKKGVHAQKKKNLKRIKTADAVRENCKPLKEKLLPKKHARASLKFTPALGKDPANLKKKENHWPTAVPQPPRPAKKISSKAEQSTTAHFLPNLTQHHKKKKKVSSAGTAVHSQVVQVDGHRRA